MLPSMFLSLEGDTFIPAVYRRACFIFQSIATNLVSFYFWSLRTAWNGMAWNDFFGRARLDSVKWVYVYRTGTLPPRLGNLKYSHSPILTLCSRIGLWFMPNCVSTHTPTDTVHTFNPHDSIKSSYSQKTSSPPPRSNMNVYFESSKAFENIWRLWHRLQGVINERWTFLHIWSYFFLSASLPSAALIFFSAIRFCQPSRIFFGLQKCG